MFRTTLLCATTLFLQSLAGCGSSTLSGLAGGYDPGGDSAAPGSELPAAPLPPPSPNQGGGGMLTAGDWDDNLNLSLFAKYLAKPPAGLPAYRSADRVAITVRSADGGPLGNARVTISRASRVLLSASTGSDGRILFVPSHDDPSGIPGTPLTLEIAPPADQTGVAPLTMTFVTGQGDLNVTLPNGQSRTPQSLDLAFVIDTTGSMGDELSYLKTEVSDIVQQVRAEFPTVDQRYALVVYRDLRDAYVTRNFDFTPDLTSFQKNLSEQEAAGGDDTPEAIQEGVRMMNQMSWRSGNVARLAFLVADAPPHFQDVSTYLSHIQQARRSGIRIYPVGASGVEVDAEYLLRITAQLTLGRYIFLTDDSGLGNMHMEPSIPCYQVTTLNKVILRSIRSELLGVHQNPDPKDIIRSVGSPVNGVCKLADGGSAYL